MRATDVMRKCPRCKIEKAPEEFYATKKGAECRICFRKRIAERKASARRFVFGYLADHPCVDCGETDPVVLEFDHVRGVKTGIVSRFILAGTMSKLIAEIEKCDVRCANCHRRKTAVTHGWYAGIPPGLARPR